MQIPTKMIGPITSKVVCARRIRLYPTDIGILTAEQIYAATGLKEWRILERYYKHGVHYDGIFDTLADPEVIRKRVQKHPSDTDSDLSHIEQGKYAHLGKKERVSSSALVKMTVGTWEDTNQ
jgi:hypothetical protein